jgi:hypothetical protein
MMRVIKTGVAVALAGAVLWPASEAIAQTAPLGLAPANASKAATEFSAQSHFRRPPTRLRVYPYYEPDFGVYPRYYPGRNAVRECNANYVPEYRPSGTVIVPRMSCFWRPG